MSKDNIKALLNLIFIVLLLLCLCAGVDYAAVDNETITANSTEMNTSNCTLIGGVHYDNRIIENKSVGVAKLHKVIHIKPKYPLITMTGKPSCSRCYRNHCSYTWRTKTYINYCPNCHHYGTLGNRHKRGSVHEKEITCFRCDSDYCINCGKEKYSWSRVYLRRP
ncbi:MAG: hypothetical protein J6Y78_18155 [Paludibacteraceae bacterium]|nr:hypothetical protein [Paludibacteraceae bacterium]